MIDVTKDAQEEVLRILSKEEEGKGLRLGVKGGGCSGLYYSMKVDATKEGDHEFDFNGLKVIVDPKSFLYLKGTTLDFNGGLEGRGFKFVNPNADKTCGCGESFSV